MDGGSRSPSSATEQHVPRLGVREETRRRLRGARLLLRLVRDVFRAFPHRPVLSARREGPLRFAWEEFRRRFEPRSEFDDESARDARDVQVRLRDQDSNRRLGANVRAVSRRE